MTDSVPVVCSLTAAAAADRAARWRSLLDDSLVDAGPIAGGRRLAFRPAPRVAAELDELVAAERDCCPFLTLTVARDGGRVILDVVAPPEAAAIVETMFETAP